MIKNILTLILLAKIAKIQESVNFAKLNNPPQHMTYPLLQKKYNHIFCKRLDEVIGHDRCTKFQTVTNDFQFYIQPLEGGRGLQKKRGMLSLFQCLPNATRQPERGPNCPPLMAETAAAPSLVGGQSHNLTLPENEKNVYSLTCGPGK